MPEIQRLAKIILTAAGAVALVACDDSRVADKRVQATLQEARLARLEVGNDENGTPTGLKKAQDLLDKAAKESEASPGTKAQVKSMLGQAQFDTAKQMIATAVVPGNREVARLMWEIDQLAQQLQASNILAESYAKLEPKEAKAAATSQAAAATGGPDKPVWVGEKASAIPTVAASQQKAAQLQDEIARQQQAIEALQTQRAAAVKQGDELQRQADAQKGQAGFETFRGASSARKQAADTQNQIDVESVKLARLQQDLALAQAQLEAVTKAKQQFEAMEAGLETQWSGKPGVAEQVMAQKALAAEILAGKSDASIAAKAAKLAKQTDETQKVYDDAEKNLQAAITSFEGAATDAGKLSGEMRTASSAVQSDQLKKAMDQLVAIYNPNVFKLSKANATLALGQLQASKAQLLAQRAALIERLKPIAQQAGLTLPKELDDSKIAEELKTVSEASAKSFADANELYEAASTGTGMTESDRNAGRAGKIYALYGQALLARALGNAKGAEESLSLAKQQRDAVMQEAKNALAALPAELVVVGVIAPATAPATTEGATTTPATTEGATTTPATTEGAAPAAEGATTTPAEPAPAPAAPTPP